MNEQNNTLVPIVIERTGAGERSYDIFSRLLKDRIIFIDGQINDATADLAVAQMLFLESEDTEREINLYINSPGGSVTAGLAIYDTMQYLKSEIRTICLGQACSMAAVLLAAGTKGKRCALPSSRIMIHQPWGGAEGQASDIGIQAKEIIRLKQQLTGYLANACGQTPDRLSADLERDFYLTPQEALSYGLIDKVLVKNQ